jgi:hypothetical protein
MKIEDLILGMGRIGYQNISLYMLILKMYLKCTHKVVKKKEFSGI